MLIFSGTITTTHNMLTLLYNDKNVVLYKTYYLCQNAAANTDIDSVRGVALTSLFSMKSFIKEFIFQHPKKVGREVNLPCLTSSTDA